MEKLNMQTFQSLLSRYDDLKALFDTYGQQLLLVLLIFALLNCFFGYALRKLWSVIPGFFLGAAAGLAAGVYTSQTTQITLALSVGCALLCAIIAFVLYRIGLFFLISGLVGFCLWHIVLPSDWTGYLLVGLIAFVVGLISVPFERISVILVTSICGSLAAIQIAYLLKGLEANLLMLGITAVLALLGILFQSKPWKERDYWDEDDEREREYRQHARDRRRREYGLPSAPSPRRRPRKRRGSSYRPGSSSTRSSSPQPSGKSRVSQNTYDFRYVPEEPDEEDDEEFEEILPRLRRKTVPQDTIDLDAPEPDEQTADPLDDTKVYPSPSEPEIASPEDATVDLSDIRQHISEEVQKIYHDEE